MKKSAFLSFVCLSISMVGGCSNSKPLSKVYLPFGKLYDTSLVSKENLEIEKNTIKISHSELSSLVLKEESFALVVYEPNNTCTCFKDFERSLNEYMFAFNPLIYSIDSKEFDGGHDTFGVNVASEESTLCLFENGKLKHQRVTKGPNDEFLSFKVLSNWMNERLILSNMLYITSSQLDSLFEGDCDFTVGFLRASCSDCSYVKDAVLYDFNKKENNVSYVIDCDSFPDSSFKDKYGLSESSNPDYGYGVGYVPTFIRYSPIKTSSYADSVIDACVYLNDKVSFVDENFTITDSFFKEERVPLLGFLGNSKSDSSVLLGKTVDETEVVSKGDSYYWKKECAAKYHDPLLTAFLNAYVSLSIE